MPLTVQIAIVPGHVPIHECVVGKQYLAGGAILADNMLEESNGFLIKCGLQPLREFGITLRIDTAVAVELVKTEPLAKELSGEPSGFWIAQHAANLRSDLAFLAELASRRRPPQLVVGQRRPEKIAQPRGQLPIGEPRPPHAFRRPLDTI